MSIKFPGERWDETKDVWGRWWAGELERPIIDIALSGSDPGRPCPALPLYYRAAFYDFSVPASAIIDRWDYELSNYRYTGDSFPSMCVDFGPGVLAAFMGAEPIPKPADNTVWFKAPQDLEIEDISFRYEPDNPWLDRIRDIYRAGIDRWGGLVQMGMTDLGGSLDVLSTFRPGEKLLLDLYDKPDEVKRLLWEEHEQWWKCFDELNAILQPLNPGYTCWTQMFSAVPFYMLQCDFAYMIGTDMFDEFVKPELVASCRRLPNCFYHLDGVGQLPHLDSLLSIPELKGIQWVPGAGKPEIEHWPEVHRKIRDAGKLIQVFGGIESLEALEEQLGSARGVCVIGAMDCSRERELHECLRRYGVVHALQ